MNVPDNCTEEQLQSLKEKMGKVQHYSEDKTVIHEEKTKHLLKLMAKCKLQINQQQYRTIKDGYRRTRIKHRKNS